MTFTARDIDAELEALVTEESIQQYQQSDDKMALCRLLLVTSGLGVILADCLEELFYTTVRQMRN
jgi:hypothetical protein